MTDVFSGSYFCSSGYVNRGAPGSVGGGGGGGSGSVGSLSQDRRQKDREALAKLSGTTVDKFFKVSCERKGKEGSESAFPCTRGSVNFRHEFTSKVL